MIVFSFLFLFVFTGSLNGFPIDTLKNNKIAPSKALEFMIKFGYLEEDDGLSSALYTEEGISDTIKMVQHYGAVPETGILDNATLNLFTAPRCGVKDIIKSRKKRYAIAVGWNKRTITYFIANWSSKLSESIVAKNIYLALETWGKYAHLKFQRVYNPDADIIVAFGRGYHGDQYSFDGSGNILAHAFFPSQDQGIGGDIHFDEDEDWTSAESNKENNRDGTDFLTVALHELGHSLGLSHSADANAVMFAYYKGYEPGQQLQLGYDDILGMYELYIRRNIPGRDPEIESGESTTSERYHTESTFDSTTTARSTPRRTTTSVTSSTIYQNTESTLGSRTTTVTYSGDWETVDEHQSHEPGKNSSTDICEGYFDAVATLREELFVFKGNLVWRLKDLSKPYKGYPVTIHQMFPDLPSNIVKIDAAYERPDGMIILFTNNKFWVFDGQRFVENSPRPISDYGLPTTLDKIDAVQIWARNGKTYFYARDRFWRYNETRKLMDDNYPRHIEKWRNIPQDLDAATTWKGVTYFFKAASYWKFDNDWVMASEQSPLPSPQLWLGCPEDMQTMQQFY